jgi:integrase
VSRSAAGESTIYRDDAGRWHGYVSMGLTDNGRRDRRHVSGKKRADVVTKVRELEQKRDTGIGGASGKAPTVGQWLEHWLTHIAARKVRASTLESYESKVRTRIIPLVGHHRLDRLQPEHVEAMFARLEGDGLSPATVLQCHRILSRAIKVAMQRGKVARNVCTLVDAPSLVRAEVVPLTADEARAMLDAAAHGRNAPRWSVALALGLRQGEALGLRWSDLDLDTSALTVRRALQRQRGKGLVFVDVKSRAGHRVLGLPAPLVDALRAHRTAQLEERMRAGSMWDDGDLIFAQVNGRPIDPGADWSAWKALLARAGVRDARLHDARHTAATLLLLQGVPARVAMQILGHSQISLTLGTYSHVMPEMATDAAARMGAVLWPVATTVAPSPPVHGAS